MNIEKSASNGTVITVFYNGPLLSGLRRMFLQNLLDSEVTPPGISLVEAFSFAVDRPGDVENR